MTSSVTADKLLEQLTDRAGGVFDVAVESRPAADKLVGRLYAAAQESGRSAVDRVVAVRGDRCSTKAAMFDEFAAVLQFPLYFGRNWDAFHDSLADNRVGGDSVVLVIVDASDLLRDESDEYLSALHVELTELARKPEEPRPGWKYWTVVFADSPDALLRFRERVASLRK